MQDTKFALSIDATDENTRGGLAEIQRQLTPLLRDPNDAGTVEVVMAEVINNVVEHAYSDTPDGIIEIALTHSREKLSVHVQDRGAAMPGNELPAGKLASLNVDFTDLPEGGFGWFMIKELTQNLRYERSQTTNNLFFEIPYSP